MSNRIAKVWTRLPGAMISACPAGKESRPSRPRFRDAESSAVSSTVATGLPERVFRRSACGGRRSSGCRKCGLVTVGPDIYPRHASVPHAIHAPSQEKSQVFATISIGCAGSAIDEARTVTGKPDSQRFPCPFCRSSRIDVIGGSLTFRYYKCDDCAESWTTMNLPASAPKRMPLLGELPQPTIH